MKLIQVSAKHMSNLAKGQWSNMTPAQRNKRIAKMNRARIAKMRKDKRLLASIRPTNIL